jgi:predicted ArsR family transcriptional regulator
VEHAREHGRVTIKEMTLLTGTSRNTLKEHFQRLLENGMLERNGQGRGVWYRSSSMNWRTRPDSSKDDTIPTRIDIGTHDRVY